LAKNLTDKINPHFYSITQEYFLPTAHDFWQFSNCGKSFSCVETSNEIFSCGNTAGKIGQDSSTLPARTASHTVKVITAGIHSRNEGLILLSRIHFFLSLLHFCEEIFLLSSDKAYIFRHVVNLFWVTWYEQKRGFPRPVRVEYLADTIDREGLGESYPGQGFKKQGSFYVIGSKLCREVTFVARDRRAPWKVKRKISK